MRSLTFFSPLLLFFLLSHHLIVALTCRSSTFMWCFCFVWRTRAACSCVFVWVWVSQHCYTHTRTRNTYNIQPFPFSRTRNLGLSAVRFSLCFIFFLRRKNTSKYCPARAERKQQDNGRFCQSKSVNIEKIIMNFAKIIWNGQNYYEHHSTIYTDNNNNKCIDGCNLCQWSSWRTSPHTHAHTQSITLISFLLLCRLRHWERERPWRRLQWCGGGGGQCKQTLRTKYNNNFYYY